MIIVLLGPSLFQLLGLGRDATPISYSTFREHVGEGRVTSVTIRGERIHGQLETPYTAADRGGQDEVQEPYTEFETYVPSIGDDELLAMIEEQGVELVTEPSQDGWFGPLLISLLPFLLLVGLGVLITRRVRSQGQQLFSMGRSRARLYQRTEEELTTFDDVAGAEGAKTELGEIIDFLRDPARFQRLGGQPPRGVLLVGPPGTGKTLLARAAAGEAHVPFFSMTGSDFMEMFVGVGASRVRNLFRDARNAAPSVVFIDELDSIGRRRGAGLGGGHDEREQTLNQLLSEMDGFESHQGVIVMAATNRPDILDPALLRPGRFDRHVVVELPTCRARLAILDIHARDKPLADDIDFEEIARATPGFSGADLENLLNEAALLAGRHHREAIERQDIEDARDKILLGTEREGMSLAPDEIELLAFHEGGHAVVAASLPHADPLHKVTIVPRGRAMGVTQQLPTGDRYIFSRDQILDRIAVMLGGRAAEHLVLDTASSGAEDDLKQVMRLARKMVLEWGMSDRLAHVALGGERDHVFLGEELTQSRSFSEATAREVDEEILRIVQGQFERVVELLRRHRDGLDRVAAALRDEEELPGERVLEILGIDQQPDDGAGSLPSEPLTHVEAETRGKTMDRGSDQARADQVPVGRPAGG
jgi:cell division protease FtsH